MNDSKPFSSPTSPHSAFRSVKSNDNLSYIPLRRENSEVRMVESDSRRPSPCDLTLTHSQSPDAAPQRNDNFDEPSSPSQEEVRGNCCTWLFQLLLKRRTRQHYL